MVRKKETLTLSVPPGTKEKLDAIADRLGITWGTKPSSSGLITKIAEQEFEVALPFALSTIQVQALRQAVRDLMDAGNIEEAKNVLTLLVDRGNLEAPLRRDLMRQVSQPTDQGWRTKVDQFIADQQPFRVIYTNSQGAALEFIARYAEIIFYEKRHFLQIWCDETSDSTDIPELKHNRCFRLDRIQALLPSTEEWRGSFDSVEVTFNLTGWLAKAYEPKLDDIQDQTLDKIRHITRRIINPFWFFREIIRYDKDCEIIAPDSVRQQFRQKIQALSDRYTNP
ncbi:MAG: WYL domain-containing protein [Alkalinema sp. CAN_BIN05]|nr:WYL domain-containing protein [Alkalinema sp. CAN_BIN05]